MLCNPRNLVSRMVTIIALLVVTLIGNARGADMFSVCSAMSQLEQPSSFVTALCTQTGPVTAVLMNASSPTFGDQMLAFLLRYMYTDKDPKYLFTEPASFMHGANTSMTTSNPLNTSLYVKVLPPSRTFSPDIVDVDNRIQPVSSQLHTLSDGIQELNRRVDSVENSNVFAEWTVEKTKITELDSRTTALIQKTHALTVAFQSMTPAPPAVNPNPPATSNSTYPAHLADDVGILKEDIQQLSYLLTLPPEYVAAMRIFFAPLFENKTAPPQTTPEASTRTTPPIAGRRRRANQDNSANQKDLSPSMDVAPEIYIIENEDKVWECLDSKGVIFGKEKLQDLYYRSIISYEWLHELLGAPYDNFCVPKELYTQPAILHPMSRARRAVGVGQDAVEQDENVNIAVVLKGLITEDERSSLETGAWFLLNAAVIVLAMILGPMFLQVVGYKLLARLADKLGMHKLARRFFHLSSSQIILDVSAVEIHNQPTLVSGNPHDWDAFSKDPNSAYIIATYRVDKFTPGAQGNGLRGCSFVKPEIDVAIAVLRMTKEEWSPVVHSFRRKPCSDPISSSWYEPTSVIKSTGLNQYSAAYFETYKISESLTIMANELGFKDMASTQHKIIPLVPSEDVYNYTGFRRYTRLTLTCLQVVSGHYHLARMLTHDFVLSHPCSHARTSAAKYLQGHDCSSTCSGEGCCGKIHVMKMADYAMDVNTSSQQNSETLGTFNAGLGFGNELHSSGLLESAATPPQMHSFGSLDENLLHQVNAMQGKRYAANPTGVDGLHNIIRGNQYVHSRGFQTPV